MEGMEEEPVRFYIREEETAPQPVHPSNQIRAITFLFCSVILMTLISVLFSFFVFVFIFIFIRFPRGEGVPRLPSILLVSCLGRARVWAERQSSVYTVPLFIRGFFLCLLFEC